MLGNVHTNPGIFETAYLLSGSVWTGPQTAFIKHAVSVSGFTRGEGQRISAKRMRFQKYPDWCGGGLIKVGVVTEFHSPMT